MPLGLRPGVSFCEASGHLVFLDIDRDRYFGLDGPADEAFRRLVDEPGKQPRSEQTQALLARGLLVDTPDMAWPSPCAPPPPARASLLDRPLPPMAPLATARALVGVMRVRLQLRTAGLAAALRDFAARKACLGDEGGAAAGTAATVAVFRQCSLLVRSHDQCLVHSLALARRLAAHGEAADLVIAVRTRPFSAHAWVQQGDLLLNERCDGVRGYSPILVL